ncbi:CLUMA_CG002165, isoform A [Clunio marinus]|uniref:CLUMA_CG002165, isoform A n=1 Tax=Clunio marinus TaxID=568069 RepID=A0A1J1HLV4_9DIPT|nr:CLUMA_CG002165, isoform A [Clunio marinus]
MLRVTEMSSNIMMLKQLLESAPYSKFTACCYLCQFTAYSAQLPALIFINKSKVLLENLISLGFKILNILNISSPYFRKTFIDFN